MPGPHERSILALALVLCALWLGAGAAPTAAQCISGDVTAEETPGNDLGDYKYTLQIAWSVPARGLSHFTINLGLGACDQTCLCDHFVIGAEDTVGTTTGTDEADQPCTVYYSAEYNCAGDPTIPGLDEPSLKFENARQDPQCDAGSSGVGLVCFYSDSPPVPISITTDQIWIKHGTEICAGELTGVLPGCITCEPTATERGSWGRLKRLYR